MKILIADDHELIRQGLRQTLQSGALDAEVLEARSAQETLAAIASHRDLDLVLLDLFMPGTGEFELLERLCSELPELPLVVLSGSRNPSHMRHCIDAGAAGFIPKSAGAEVMLKAIDLVLAGGLYIPPELLQPGGETEELPPELQPMGGLPTEIPDSLTQRQVDVLRLLGDGLSNKRIARELGLSENTVKIHVTAILRALQLDNRTQAGIVAQKMGLTSRS
jgi:DNA-binding NarL/FixJ family response regulator